MFLSIIVCFVLLAGLTTAVFADLTSGNIFGNNPEQMGRQPGGRMQQPGGGFQPGMGMPQDGGMGGSQNIVNEPGEIVTGDTVNSASDLESDMGNAVRITMSEEENEVKIEESGTYIISGTASDGRITVKKGTTGVVLVLENLDLTSKTGAPISLNKESEVKVIISGTVTLTDAEDSADEYAQDTETADAYDGAAVKIKSGAVAAVTGSGTLNIIGKAKNGIKAGDDSPLVIDGPDIRITAVNDGINVNYDVTILSGSLMISSGDDGIHAERILTIGKEDGSGPDITIPQCGEALEGTVVNIFGGNININSRDDAINAANKDGVYKDVMAYSINMTGGNVTITGQTDGFDSNGNINLIGGSAVINVQYRMGEAGIDYDGAYYLSDDFEMTNAGGVSGPDGMGGGMGHGQGRGQGGWGRP